MSSTVLTHEELAALREETRRESGTQDLDLTGVERLQRQNMTQLDRALTRLAVTTQLELSRTLRIACEATPTPPELVTSTAVRHLLERNSMSAPLFIAGDHAGWLGLPGELCFFLVERTFGGDIPDPDQDDKDAWHPTRTALTDLERRTVWPTFEALVGGLSGALTDDNAPIAVGGAPNDPEPELPDMCEALAGGIEIDVAGTHFRVDLIVLASFRTRQPPQPGEDAVESISLRARVKKAHVEITSELGGTDVKVSELLTLKPGDVLRLDRSQSDALPLFVETVPKFLARPLRRNGNFALQIETEIQ